MVRKSTSLPKHGELVICKVKGINPNSVIVSMEEYGKDGMVHVSEIASGWVRDIRHHARVGEAKVCRVVNLDPSRDHVSLSMKRVSDYDKKHKLDEWKRERKAEKLLMIAAKELGKTADAAYKEVGFKMQEEFGEISVALQTALKNPELLEKRGIPKNWIDALRSVAEKEMQDKTATIKANLNIVCYKPNGVEIIKDELMKSGLNIHYLAAAKYSVDFEASDMKKGQKQLEEKLTSIVANIKHNGGEGSFEILKA